MQIQRRQKGFTLVELLVVIAIIAILATVSIIGYTQFIKKANQSNALSELNQIRNVVITSVIEDGEEEVAISNGESIKFEYDGETLSVTLVSSGSSGESLELTEAKVLEAINILAEAGEFHGTLSVVPSIEDGVVVTSIEDIEEIKYEYVEGVIAVWDIAANTVEIQ